MGVHLQKVESRGALVLEEQESKYQTYSASPLTKSTLSYGFSAATDPHLALNSFISDSNHSKEGKCD